MAVSRSSVASAKVRTRPATSAPLPEWARRSSCRSGLRSRSTGVSLDRTGRSVRFVLTLALYATLVGRPATIDQRRSVGAFMTGERRDACILVVDDSVDIRELLAIGL